MNNIYIIGFMGTGKSSTGRELALKLGRVFSDLDGDIEQMVKKSIKDIFEQDGEPAFRKAETKALKDVSGMEKAVIACGGGIVLVPGNVAIMKKTGTVVCLTASLREIETRTAATSSRPLLNVTDPGKTIWELFGKRLPLYKAAADLSIDTTGKSPVEVAEFALMELSRFGKT